MTFVSNFFHFNTFDTIFYPSFTFILTLFWGGGWKCILSTPSGFASVLSDTVVIIILSTIWSFWINIFLFFFSFSGSPDLEGFGLSEVVHGEFLSHAGKVGELLNGRKGSLNVGLLLVYSHCLFYIRSKSDSLCI